MAVSEQDLSCPICYNVFRDPVLLSCTHSFCRECLKTWWEETPLRNCPICKRSSCSGDPPLNRALSNLDSDAHKNHIFKPIDEVTPGFRNQLEDVLQRLAEQLQDVNKSKIEFSAAATHVEAQARLTERQIQDQFKRLHQFLEEEEQSRISALREEEQQKRRSLEDKMAAVNRDMEALSETITATKKHMASADVSFLLQYKAALERVKCCPPVVGPELGPGALIDQAKHVRNLGFNIWKNMKDLFQFYPVVLDPNTGHPELSLTGDLTNVKYGERQKFPENPERFGWHRVLGSEGFSSGTHSWDVEVSGDDYWSVGVVSESVQRKAPMNTGVWEIRFHDGQYHAVCRPKQDKTLSLEKNLQRIRVKLDFDKGQLSFSDADTEEQLHVVTKSFSEKLFPCFSTINNRPLQIIPKTISVKIK
uniref:Uncharacterized protein n=1 Tax=Knipowitschia caucasica TaxID=637954 RepID=A0AAV2ML77_KNICA